MLKAINLTKSYNGTKALNDVSLNGWLAKRSALKVSINMLKRNASESRDSYCTIKKC